MFSVLRCYGRCRYFVGWINVVRPTINFAPALVGNVPGASSRSNINDLKTPSRNVPCAPAECSPYPTRAVEDPVSLGNPPTSTMSGYKASLDSPGFLSTITVQSSLQVGAIQTRSHKVK